MSVKKKFDLKKVGDKVSRSVGRSSSTGPRETSEHTADGARKVTNTPPPLDLPIDKEGKEKLKFENTLKCLNSGDTHQLTLIRVKIDDERAEQLALAIATCTSPFYRVKLTQNQMSSLSAQLLIGTIVPKKNVIESWEISKNSNIKEEVMTEVVSSILQEFSYLRELDFSYTQFGKAALKLLIEGLHKSKRITTIKLEGCHLGTSGITQLFQALSTNTSVTTLFTGNNQCEDFMKKIESLFQLNKCIIHLSLDNTKFSHEEFVVLSKILELKVLKKLSVGNSGMDMEAFTILLLKDSQLSSLRVPGNSLTEGWAEIVVDHLQRGGSLTSVDIGNCSLESGISKIISLDRLKKIEGRGNPWNNKEIIAISNSLKTSTSLYYLGLRACRPFTLADITPLSEGIFHNKSLLKLDLRENEIDEEGGLKLSETVGNNHTLTQLLLTKNNMSSKMLMTIHGVLVASQITHGFYTKAEFEEMVELFSEYFLNDPKWVHIIVNDIKRKKVIVDTMAPIIKYCLKSPSFNTITCREDEEIPHSKIIGFAIWQATNMEAIPIEKLMEKIMPKVLFYAGQKAARKTKALILEYETFVQTQTGDADWNLLYWGIDNDTECSPQVQQVWEHLMQPLQLANMSNQAVCCCLTDKDKIEDLKDWGFKLTGEGLLDGKLGTYGLTRAPGASLDVSVKIKEKQQHSSLQAEIKEGSDERVSGSPLKKSEHIIPKLNPLTYSASNVHSASKSKKKDEHDSNYPHSLPFPLPLWTPLPFSHSFFLIPPPFLIPL